MSDKQYKVEWSFSFDKLGESINKMVGSLGNEEEVKLSSFSEPLGSTTSATVNLHFSLGENTLKGLAASDNLMEADITHVGEIEFVASGGPEATLKLRQKGPSNVVTTGIKQVFGAFSKRHDLRWDVRLNRDVPFSLNIDGGVGPSHLDLSELKLRNLRFDSGVGETDLRLPTGTESYNVKIDGGVGATNIHLPESGSINMVIKAGVGSVKVYAPAGMAVRAQVEGGLGSVNMPSHFTRTRVSDDFMSKGGVWETPGFDQAEHKVTINFEGGVGSFKILSDVTRV